MSKLQYSLPLWALKAATKLSGKDTGISDELKHRISELGCIFIHIPKCAGNAVQQSLFREVVFGHQTIRQYQIALPKTLYEKTWKFTVTRNPWERIVSAWRFLEAGGFHEHDAEYFAENLSQYPTFDDFVNDWLVYQDLDLCGCAHFKTQLHYIRDFRGRVAMDYMVKLSDLNDEYHHIRKRLGGDELVVHNEAKDMEIKHATYLKNQETCENIAKIYAEDIEVLGYESST
mgnify:CR=1 FL=1